jgi:hypothetical protein
LWIWRLWQVGPISNQRSGDLGMDHGLSPLDSIPPRPSSSLGAGSNGPVAWYDKPSYNGETMRLTLVLGAIIFGTLLHVACASQVWLSPVDPISQPSNPAAKHYMDLFRPKAQWDRAANEIQVVKVSTQFLHTAPEDDLNSVIKELKRRKIGLAMEGFMLTATVRCGNGGVESYASPSTIMDIIERLTRLGGSLQYVAMDERVHSGHYAVGPIYCHDSVEALAAQMAPNVKALKSSFPGITFGDIEPLNSHTLGRIDTMLDFARAFRQATGEPISFIHADIIWADTWLPQLIEWQRKANAAGIGLGIIIDGDNQDKDDLAWAGKAIKRYGAIMSGLRRSPDQIVFQSWMSHPLWVVPDNEPGTLTSIVVRAVGH